MGIGVGKLVVTRRVLINKLNEICSAFYGVDCYQVVDTVANPNFRRENAGRGEAVLLDILFPKFIITNRDNLEHEITNLVVRISFPVKIMDNVVTRDLDVMNIDTTLYRRRLTASNVEIASHYAHSHLSGQDPQYFGRWGQFCLGEGPLASMIPELRSDEGMDLELLELIILQIRDYVSWESIEGTPYKYIKKMVQPKNRLNGVQNNTIDNVLKTLMTNLDKNDDFSFLTMYSFNGKRKVQIDADNSVFTDLIVSAIKNRYRGSDLINLIAVKRGAQYFQIINSGSSGGFGSLSSISYKFQDKTFNMATEYHDETQKKEKQDEEQQHPNPEISRAIQRKLKYLFEQGQTSKPRNQTISGESQVTIEPFVDDRHQLPPQLNW